MHYLGKAYIGLSITVLAGAVLAGCSQPAPINRDIGSMAIPAPSATGAVNRAAVGSGPASSTGSMAFPAPVAGSGTLTPAPVGRDTGSMGIPNSSMGNLRQAPRAN